MFRRFTPQLDVDFSPAPAPLGKELWSIDRRLRLFGSVVPCRSVVVRLSTGEVIVIGAPALPSRCAPEIARLGSVSAVVAPNSFHYLYAAETLRELPGARLVLAPGLRARVSTLPPGLDLERGATPPWSEELATVVFGPVRGVSEIVFFHAPSRTVVFTDLAASRTPNLRAVDAWIHRAYGMPSELGPSRNARMILRADPDESRRALQRVLEWPFEAIVVAHGEAIVDDARERFRAGFAAFL